MFTRRNLSLQAHAVIIIAVAAHRFIQKVLQAHVVIIIAVAAQKYIVNDFASLKILLP